MGIKPKKTDRLITISVDPKEKAKFRKAAKAADRSLSNWAKRAMDCALKGGGGNRTRSLTELAAA